MKSMFGEFQRKKSPSTKLRQMVEFDWGTTLCCVGAPLPWVLQKQKLHIEGENSSYGFGLTWNIISPFEPPLTFCFWNEGFMNWDPWPRLHIDGFQRQHWPTNRKAQLFAKNISTCLLIMTHFPSFSLGLIQLLSPTSCPCFAHVDPLFSYWFLQVL